MSSFLGWFDDSPPSHKSAARKIEEAVERYREKFGKQPDVCLVNPADFVAMRVDSVQVRAVDHVPPNHFWVGREEVLLQAPFPL